LVTAYPSEYGHALRKAHGANKPPQLMRQLISFFTKSGESVLDPFAGVGGTLLGASLCHEPRKAVGLEINTKWVDIYHQVLQQDPALQPQTMLQGDCRTLMEEMEPNSFDFIATDPPYNTHLERTMCDGRYPEHANRRTDYDMRSDEDADLANQPDYEHYLQGMGDVLAGCQRVLKPGRYLALICRNAYQKGEYIFTHADLAQVAKVQGWVPKGEIVWYQAGTRLRPYGYPHSYVPNIAYQFILILQKPKAISPKAKGQGPKREIIAGE
jgi:DNA modification methylase